MYKCYTFDDVLLSPRFSTIESRKDVDTSTLLGFYTQLSLKLPVISANMDTVTDVDMAIAMSSAGGIGCLHRFMTIGDNIWTFRQATQHGGNVIVSVGLGEDELARAKSLHQEGASYFCLDVAHGAQMSVVEQYKKLKAITEGSFIIVGNFASGFSISQFEEALGYAADAYKVGVGPGSACTTRIKTGCGVPQLSAIMECSRATHASIIADGGMRTPGDIVKALAAGADAVMLGGMLAGTSETPGKIIEEKYIVDTSPTLLYQEGIRKFKKYRGSASKESYLIYGKNQAYITAEGESFTVPYKGPVSAILKDIEGGLRSGMTYQGARTIRELQDNATFIEVSDNTVTENGAHGKR